MSTVCFYNGYIYNDVDASFYRGAVLCEDGFITDISSNPDMRFTADTYVDLEGKYLTPGFTDAHTHGRSGYDFNTASESEMQTMLNSYASAGVTSVFPTLASSTFDDLIAQGRKINALKKLSGTAHVAGVHLEGRYLNAQKKGAHNPELLVDPAPSDVPALVENLSTPLHVSAAYELDDDELFAKALVNAGATLGLAHTCADYSKTLDLYEKYQISLTHMYNAMPPLHHREGGAVCAGLCSDMYTELICDGIHVSADMVRLAFKCKGSDKLVLITDSMEATDCPDGRYSIAGLPVIVENSIAKTLDGALAGSTLNLEKAVNNLARFADTSISSAIKCATSTPCKMLGIYNEYGSVSVGKHADFIVADVDDQNKAFKIKNVYIDAVLYR